LLLAYPVLGQSAAAAKPYINRTFRCLFESQVLCGVSGSWALCKNGLQMAVAKNMNHAYVQSYIASCTARRAHRPAPSAALSWQSAAHILAAKPYINLTFRCLFVFQVLCGVSGSWALCKNGLQMAVAKNMNHAYVQSYIASCTARRAHRPAPSAALSWQSAAHN
jgi:ABC-type Co2+ transport system permease subunit